MDPDMVMLECEELMEKTIDYLKQELRGVRTGRASTGLIDHVKIDCYGSLTELRNVASLATPEPNMIVIKPFDPGTIADIVKGIERADLGLNPQSDQKVVRVPVPSLSGERRKQLAGQVRQMGESAKVSLRNARRETNRHIDQVEKDKTKSVSEDEAKKMKSQVQDWIKEKETQVDDLAEAKMKEIMEV